MSATEDGAKPKVGVEDDISDENIDSISDEADKIEKPECVDTLTNIKEDKEVDTNKKLLTEHMFQTAVHLDFDDSARSVLIFGAKTVNVKLTPEDSDLVWKTTRGRVELLPGDEAAKALTSGNIQNGALDKEFTLGGEEGFLLLILKGKCVLDVTCVTAQFFSISYYE